MVVYPYQENKALKYPQSKQMDNLVQHATNSIGKEKHFITINRFIYLK
jgi:hypothetical protein